MNENNIKSLCLLLPIGYTESSSRICSVKLKRKRGKCQKIYVKKIEGNRYDIRDPLSYVKAILDFSRGRENLKNE
ncbi:MAG: hypothetical protein KAT65_21410, partial [Methanophagales archaeon]|nr:hypothetical protein [Methanophagales archaeon]